MSARYAIIEVDGKRQHVLDSTLDGYPEAAVIKRDVPPPPEFNKGHDGGKWLVDPEAKQQAERRGRRGAMTREQLIDSLDDIEARLKAVEVRHAD